MRGKVYRGRPGLSNFVVLDLPCRSRFEIAGHAARRSTFTANAIRAKRTVQRHADVLGGAGQIAMHAAGTGKAQKVEPTIVMLSVLIVGAAAWGIKVHKS